jgi:FkbM family methyltransferase
MAHAETSGSRAVTLLGAAARVARSAGLERVTWAVRDAADLPFLLLRRPPLAVEVEGIRVHGFLRQRSDLAEIVKPGTTYRELFLRTLEPGMTVVDAGAHVGVYTLLASRGIGPTGRVIAFEPDPYNFAALAYNVRRAGAANVRIVHCALGDARRPTTFHVSLSSTGSSLARRDSTDVATTAQMTSLDEELRGESLDSLLVKLNIEGSEPLALAGMRETLARASRVVLFVEVAADLLDDPRALLRTLLAQGLAVYSIDHSTQSVRPIDPDAELVKAQLLALRPDDLR